MRPTTGPSLNIKRRLLLLAPLLLSALPSAVHAQITNTWNGSGADANWSTQANWNANAVPTSGATAGLDFVGSAATSNNDLGAFQLNVMQFDVAASLILSGNDLNFIANGAATPVLTQKTAFNCTINNDLILTNNLTVNLAGSGTVALGGVISGAGSLMISSSNATYTARLFNAN